MIVRLSDVPASERHLLFCSKLMPRRRSRRRRHGRRSAPPKKPLSMTDTHTGEASSLIPIAAGFDAAGTSVGAA
jgi:hypothetical protein